MKNVTDISKFKVGQIIYRNHPKAFVIGKIRRIALNTNRIFYERIEKNIKGQCKYRFLTGFSFDPRDSKKTYILGDKLTPAIETLYFKG